MDCKSKIKNTCTEQNYATCVYYELDIPDFSDLSSSDCVTLEDTTKDIYEILGVIKESLDLSNLGNSCIDYTENSEGEVEPKSAFIAIEEKLCEVEDKINSFVTDSICNIDITTCGIDLGNLVDDCNNAPITLKDLLQILVNQHTS